LESFFVENLRAGTFGVVVGGGGGVVA